MRMHSIVFSLILLMMIPGSARAQAWSGILSPSRAIDWASAGVIGGIPSASWPQCGSTIPPYTGDASTINNAIAACGTNKCVTLGAGTFTLSTSIDFLYTSNVCLRGQGANATFVVFTGSSKEFGINAQVFLVARSTNYIGGEQNACDWTAGYAPGTTVVTVSNCGSTTPAAGSLSNLVPGSLLILDQLDESIDTGTIWNCLATGVCSNGGSGGSARIDGTCLGSLCNRSQQQLVTVTNVSGSNITISPALRVPNWLSAQKPQITWATTLIRNSGIENMSLDYTGDGATGEIGVWINNCYGCWVKGIRSIDAGRSHVSIQASAHATVQDSYFYASKSNASRSYGVEELTASDDLVQNNIMQQLTEPIVDNAGGTGEVNGYNFTVYNIYGTPGWMIPGINTHGSGSAFNLAEGNISNGFMGDNVHGTHNLMTAFRNQFTGNQYLCGNLACNSQTIPIHLYAGTRYYNIIGNVLGQAGYHNMYTCLASPTACNGTATHGDRSIYALGETGNGGYSNSANGNDYCINLAPNCSPATADFDTATSSSLMRWGNYDVVTNAVRWCGSSSDPGWSTTCGSTSEVPTGLASYSNAVPSSTSLPESFYLSSKPSWFGSVAYPPIGPDVSGGNISGVGGYANMNPAMACYINTMGGPSSGGGPVLPFDAASCYGLATPAPPINVIAVVQ